MGIEVVVVVSLELVEALAPRVLLQCLEFL